MIVALLNLTSFLRQSTCASAACLSFLILLSSPFDTAAQIVDLRDGVRTNLYGGFGGNPPAGDSYGWAMAFGDVDGDGYTDFLSSSANTDGPNDENNGRERDVYLIFGGPMAQFDSTYAVDAGGADIVFYRGGFALACADIDADGYDDVLLAESIVRVIFGGPRHLLRREYNFYPNHPDYTPADMGIVGSSSLGGTVIKIQNFLYDYVTYGLVAGDLNADGYADIVIGHIAGCDIPGACLDGAVYVVFGRPRDQFPPKFDVDRQSEFPYPDVVIHGDEIEQYPLALAIGDMDGDGIDDLIATTQRAWGEDDALPFTGEVHGFWGKKEWKTDYDNQIEEFDFVVQGTYAVYTPGYRVVVGDLDGDGRDDLILGVITSNVRPDDRMSMGEYRVIFGRPRPEWPFWGRAVDMTDVLILGAETGDVLDTGGPFEWGICFAMATGDRDGDAYDDLMIGAGRLRRPDDGTRPGGGYLLYGRPRSEWQPFIDLRDGYDMVIYGVDYTGSPGRQFDRWGYVVGMGDIDGNDRDEMFIAAPFADGPNNSIPDCGEIYVIFDDEATPSTDLAARSPAARAMLLPNYPNPFKGVTGIGFSAPSGETVSLTVYDAMGREVAQPLPPQAMVGTERVVEWTPVDATGNTLPSGIYFIKLRAGTESHARKVVLVR